MGFIVGVVIGCVISVVVAFGVIMFVAAMEGDDL